MTPSTPPPRLARLLLRLRRLGDRRPDIAADLHELFQSRAAERGLRHARRRYYLDVLSFYWTGLQVRDAAQPPRPARLSRLLAEFADDVRFGLRVLRRQAGVMSIAIGGLSLAIGVCTAVFSIANAFNFRPLGVDDPDAVVRVVRTIGATRARLEGWPYADYLRMRQAATRVTIEASASARLTVADGPNAEAGAPVAVQFVSGSLIGTFGGRAQLGRILTLADDAPGAVPVAVLQHSFWKRRFDGNPSIVGRTLLVNGTPVAVVGVLTSRFTGPFVPNRAASILLPLHAADVVEPFLGPFHPTSQAPVDVIGRLLPRASTGKGTAAAAPVEQELTAIAVGLGWVRDRTSSRAMQGIRVSSQGDEFTAQDAGLLAILLTIVGLIVVLAAANVANVLLAGATVRRQEIVARLALGASRRRLVRQLLTESGLVAAVAGLAGLVLSLWLTPIAASLAGVPPAVDVPLDARVFLFVAAVSIGAGLAAGFAPARHGTRGDLASALRGGPSIEPGRAGRLRSLFLAIQAAAAIVLLVMTALFARALVNVSTMDFGFDYARLVSVSAFAPRSGGLAPSAEFWPIAIDRVRALPRVQGAALVEYPPFASAFHPIASTLDGRRYAVVQNRAQPEYFSVAGFRFARGRAFTPDEVRQKTPVAVITADLARDFWRDDDPVGASLGRVADHLASIRVVGVIDDVLEKIYPPNYYDAASIYLPLNDLEVARLVVGVAGDPGESASAIRSTIASIDPLRRPSVSPVSEGVAMQLQGPRTLASIAGVVGGLALVLGVVGVFGVTAFVINQRRREVSIRIAVGATHGEVMRLLVWQGMRPVTIGLAGGLLLALGGTQVIARALYAGVRPYDPIAYGAAGAVLFVTALAAIAVAVRRGMALDPASVLKDQ